MFVWVVDLKFWEGGKMDWVFGYGYDCCYLGLEGWDEMVCYGNSNCVVR